jgi:hypothetical protein
MIDPKLREDRPRATDRVVRQFAALCILVFSSLALVDAYLRHRNGRALVFAFLAAVLGPLGLIRPSAIRPVFATAIAVTSPIGWVVSRVLLGVIFYAVFTPIALLFRLKGRDTLHRRRNANASTYWQPRQQSSDPLKYLHQS